VTKAVAKKKPPEDTVEFFDIEQRSDTWFDLRKGIATASKFSVVLASGKDGGESVGRDKYMKLLAGEILSGQVAESFRSEAMERGNRMEPEAREWYERSRFVNLTSVGFIRRTVVCPLGNDFKIGASPDSQVSAKKGLEIKSVAPHLLVDVTLKGAGGFPTEHRAQLQGTMFAAGWEQMDLVLYFTGWPRPPVFTVDRDEAYIARLKAELELFDAQLQRLVDRVRNGATL
jgi:hypothetical protein